MRHLLILPLILTPSLGLAQVDEPGGLDETFWVENSHQEYGDLPLENSEPGQLDGTELTGADGETIGTVETVIEIENGPDKLVIATGGFDGLSTRRVLVNLSDVAIESQDGTVTAKTRLTRDLVDGLAEYDGI